MAVWQRVRRASPALKFVLLVGVMSFFADFAYEGSRSIIGPYLGLLGVVICVRACRSGVRGVSGRVPTRELPRSAGRRWWE
jgi:hypothetical protein